MIDNGLNWFYVPVREFISLWLWKCGPHFLVVPCGENSSPCGCSLWMESHPLLAACWLKAASDPGGHRWSLPSELLQHGTLLHRHQTQSLDRAG